MQDILDADGRVVVGSVRVVDSVVLEVDLAVAGRRRRERLVEQNDLERLLISRLYRQARRLNRKSVLSWARGSTRRSAAEPGEMDVGSGGGLLEGDLHSGEPF